MIDCIAELNKRDIDYIKAGISDVMILCPFHTDTDPSLGIDLERGIFHCFGCDISGPFYKLIAKLDDISISEAKQRFQEEDSVDITLNNLGKLFEDDEKPLRYYSKEAFHKTFPSVIGTPGEAYMTERRKIRPEMLLRFDVRWGRAGKYKNRVILPIYTLKGKLLSWAARAVLEGEKPEKRKARAARSTLYGAYELMRIRRECPVVILVEGEIDTLWLQQHGLFAVSVMGTAGITDEQRALLISMWCRKVILSYDADEAGKKATKKGYDSLEGLFAVEVVELPNGRDPNDLTEAEVKWFYGRRIGHV